MRNTEETKLKCPACGSERFIRTLAEVVEVFWDEEIECLTDDFVSEVEMQYKCVKCGFDRLNETLEAARNRK